MSKFDFRLATPEDAPAFAKWISESRNIDPKDIKAGLKENNPTAVYFVVTKDDVPVLFAPCFCTMTLAHLGISQDAEPIDKAEAMEVLVDGLSAFAVQYGVRELITYTNSPEYPIAKWALNHGFDLDERKTLRLDINKLMREVANEKA